MKCIQHTLYVCSIIGSDIDRVRGLFYGIRVTLKLYEQLDK